MTASVSFLGDSLGDNLGDVLGDFESVDAVLEAAEGTMVLRYDAEHFTPGTPPDVAAVPNRITEGADISQGTEAKRPHSDGSGADAVFNFDRAALQELQNGAVTQFASAGDVATLFLVASGDNATLGGLWTGELSGNFSLAQQGIAIAMQSTGVFARFLPASGATQVNRTGTTTGFHVIRASIESARLAVAIDGVESETIVATSGLSLAQNGVSMGSTFVSTAMCDDGIKHMSCLVGATPAIVLAVEAALQAYYGTPALP